MARRRKSSARSRSARGVERAPHEWILLTAVARARARRFFRLDEDDGVEEKIQKDIAHMEAKLKERRKAQLEAEIEKLTAELAALECE